MKMIMFIANILGAALFYLFAILFIAVAISDNKQVAIGIVMSLFSILFGVGSTFNAKICHEQTQY
jgi:hypothetical protein